MHLEVVLFFYEEAVLFRCLKRAELCPHLYSWISQATKYYLLTVEASPQLQQVGFQEMA
jgi:hypothetical protein